LVYCFHISFFWTTLIDSLIRKNTIQNVLTMWF
jgi:hypothetical protein